MIRLRYQVLLLVAAVLGVYYPTLFAPLNSVDDPGLYLGLLNADGFHLPSIFLPGGAGGYYRPLLVISFAVDKYVWGLEESFMHLNNILLHLGNTLLVFAIVRRAKSLLGRQPSLLALVAALFFTFHPLNTEPVNWISGRTDLLAAFFLLLTVWLLLCRPRSVEFSLVAALSLLLACLAKETAVFFLPAAIVLPFFLQGKKEEAPAWKTVFFKSLPHGLFFVMTGLCYFLLRTQALAKGDRVTSGVVAQVVEPQGDILMIIRTLFKTIGFYAKKLLVPFPLNFGIIHVSDFYILPGVVICLLVLWMLWRRNLTSFFLVAAAMVGSSALLVPLLSITWTPVAERYMYIPLALFVVGIALFFSQYSPAIWTLTARKAIVASLMAVAAIGTLHRNFVWQDNLSLFQDTVRKSPDFIPARNELAIAFNQHGETEKAFEIYKSFEVQEGLKNFQYGLVNKAGAFAKNGDFEEARKTLEEALKNPGIHEKLILEKMLEVNKLEVLNSKLTSETVYPDNVKLLTRLYEITGNPFYQYRLGVTHLHRKNYRQAQGAFAIVCKTAPKDSYYFDPAQKLAVTLNAKYESNIGKGLNR